MRWREESADRPNTLENEKPTKQPNKNHSIDCPNMRSAYLLDGQLAAEARVAELVQEALAAYRLAVALVERRPGDRTRAAVAHKVLRMPGLAQRGQRLPKSFVLQLVSDESACLQMARLSGDSRARAPQSNLHWNIVDNLCAKHTHTRD